MTDAPEYDVTLADWSALTAYVKARWPEAEMGEDGASFSLLWKWDDSKRTQMLLVRTLRLAERPWVEWTSALAERKNIDLETAVTAIENAVLGRLERDEKYYCLSHLARFEGLTPRLFDELTSLFAGTCDNLEEELTGGRDVH